MNIVNLTRGDVTIMKEDGTVIQTIKPSGNIAHVTSETIRTGVINGIPTSSTIYGEIEGLPAPEADTIYITSSIVAQRARRNDVYAPKELVRDPSGAVIGCLSLGLG